MKLLCSADLLERCVSIGASNPAASGSEYYIYAPRHRNPSSFATLFHTIPFPFCGTALYTTIARIMLTNWLSCQFHLCPFTNRLSRNFCALKVIASTTFFSCCCWSGLDRRCSYRMTDAETNANKTKKGKGTFYKRYVETSLLARSSCLIVQKSHLMEEQTLCIDTTVVVYWTAAICILYTVHDVLFFRVRSSSTV